MAANQVAAYIVSQLLGALLGGAVALSIMHDDMGYPSIGKGYTWKGGIVAEIIYTGIIVLAMLHATTTPQTQGNSYFGIAVGLAVGGATYTAGDISGAAFNPAIGLALPALAGEGEDIWVYIIGPLIGAVLAGILFYTTEDRSHYKRRYSILMEETGAQPESHTFAKFMPPNQPRQELEAGLLNDVPYGQVQEYH